MNCPRERRHDSSASLNSLQQWPMWAAILLMRTANTTWQHISVCDLGLFIYYGSVNIVVSVDVTMLTLRQIIQLYSSTPKFPRRTFSKPPQSFMQGFIFPTLPLVFMSLGHTHTLTLLCWIELKSSPLTTHRHQWPSTCWAHDEVFTGFPSNQFWFWLPSADWESGTSAHDFTCILSAYNTKYKPLASCNGHNVMADPSCLSQVLTVQ